MLFITLLGLHVLEPFLKAHMQPAVADMAACAVIYILIAIFIGPLMNLHNNLYTSLWLKRRSFRLPLLVLTLIKVAVITIIAMIPLAELFKVQPIWLFFILVAVIAVLAKYDGMTGWYL